MPRKHLWRECECLQVGRDRSAGRAQLLRELAEAGPRGGGEVEARPHGLAQRRGTGRRQGTHLVGQLFLNQQRVDDVSR